MNNKIVLVRTRFCTYPKLAPYRPSEVYPELLYKENISGEVNSIFQKVRKSFYMMGYDAENYGTMQWNPLGKFIKPGNKVILKPNMVTDKNHNHAGGELCLYTHPSVVAAVMEYVLIALNGKGEIVIGDAPMQECDFDNLISESGYREMVEYYQKICSGEISIRLIDFRDLHSTVKLGVHRPILKNYSGGIIVDLGEESEFFGLTDEEYESLRITNYNPDELKMHHNSKRNEYCINHHILEADVVINIPKPKTHRKAGVTIALKNMVGANARKEYLPHHMTGSKSEGGDEYLYASKTKRKLDELYDRRNKYCSVNDKQVQAFLTKVLIKGVQIIQKINKEKDTYYEGSWYGNNTINKTIVDLNKILFYADKTGQMQDTFQRKYLIVADMIVSGEKEGPVAPSPKDVGMIAVGENPVCFDEVIATLMGADISKIPTIRTARKIKGRHCYVNPEDEAVIESNLEEWNGKTINELSRDDLLYFEPTTGWMNAFYKNNVLEE